MKNRCLLLIAFCTMMLTAKAQLVEVVSGLSFPWGLALDGNTMYVSQYTGAKISKFDITQPAPTVEDVLTGISNPTAMVLNSNELIYALSSQGIYKININDVNPTPIPILTAGFSITSMQLSGDILYVGDEGTNKISKIDISASNPTLEDVVIGVASPGGIVIKDGMMYFNEFIGGTLNVADLSQNPIQSTTLISGLTQPTGLDLNGNFLYISSGAAIKRVDLNAATPTCENVVTTNSGTRYTTFDGIDLYIALTNGKVEKLAIGQPVWSNLTTCSDNATEILGGASPTGGSYSGANVTDNADGETFTFDVASAGLGTHAVTYTISGASVDITVEVVASPTVSFTAPSTITIDAGVQAGLGGGTPTGGVYSGPGVTDDANGMTYSFDPAAAGVGAHTITYNFTDANGCSGAASGDVMVGLADDDCAGANDINPVFGGMFNVPQTTSVWDNTLYTSNNDPTNGIDCFVDGPSLTNTIWYTFLGDGNTYSIESVNCNGSTNYNGDPQVAIYSGDCGNLTAVACNEDEDEPNSIYNIYVELTTEVGVTYLMMIDGYSGTVGEFCLEVTNLTEPVVFPALDPVCPDAPASAFGGASPAGGTYSGSGVTDDGNGMTFTFDPAAAGGTGTYTITYTAPGGGTATSDIEVLAAPTVGFTAPGNVDLNAGVQTGLGGGTPTGGTYSGTGVTDDANGMTYSFDPAAAGVGTFTITYSYTDANSCSGTASGDITVTQAFPDDDCGGANDINPLFGQTFNEPQVSSLWDNSLYTSNNDPTNGIDCFDEMGLTNTIWYTFVGDGNTYRIRSVVCSATTYEDDTQVAIYSGDDCSNLTPVACNEDEDFPNQVYNISVDIMTEPGVTYFMMIDSWGANPDGGEFCLEVTNLTECLLDVTLSLDGGGNTITVAPGAMIAATGDYEISNPVSCPTCIQQLIIGIESDAIECIYNDIPDVCPNFTTGMYNTTITAPATPGVYNIYSNNPFNFDCTLSDYAGADGERAILLGTITVEETISTKDFEIINGLSIMPNPATDHFTIKTEFLKAGDLSITLFNVLGKAVVRENVSVASGGFTKTMKTQDFTSGIYFCELKSGNESIVKKVVIK